VRRRKYDTGYAESEFCKSFGGKGKGRSTGEGQHSIPPKKNTINQICLGGKGKKIIKSKEKNTLIGAGEMTL